MAVRLITVLPQDAGVLRSPAKPVREIDKSIFKLVEDMIDSMYAANGVGLAAPQIGVSLRVVVIGKPRAEPFALINPEIVKTSGERELLEGCLSVPGYRGTVLCSSRLVAKAIGLNGKDVRIRAKNDLLAQVLEHEINHINGILYIDHVQTPDDLRLLREMQEDDGEPAETPLDGARQD